MSISKEFFNETGERRRLTLREMFGCDASGPGHEHFKLATIIRYMIVVIGLIIAVTTLFLWRVILEERSAIHHQCENNYVLWPMAVAYQCLFHAIVINYVFTEKAFWAGTSDRMFFVILTAMLGWYFLVYFPMPHICLTFYTIKYPLLLAFPHVCGPVAILLWIAISLRRMAHMMSDTDNEPTVITSLFYTENETFVPKLFEETKINDYRKGVTKWQESITTRNETLKEAYAATVDIHSSTRSQSQLLSQMTEAVKDVGEKANKANAALDKQKRLIGVLETAVSDAENQLSGMSDKKASMSLGCTYTDYFKWTAISFMCCGVALLGLLAVPKWLALFGIKLGINL